MQVYQKPTSPVFKWLFGLIVFLFAMTVTLADVGGVGVPRTDKGVNEQFDKTSNTKEQNYQRSPSDDYQDDTGNPIPVPEPATLILLASGLGVMRLIHRKHKK